MATKTLCFAALLLLLSINYSEAKATKEVLLAIGGSNKEFYLRSVELYDPELNDWRDVAPLPSFRTQFAATVLNNKVYVCGGISDEDEYTSCDTYDPIMDEWNAEEEHIRDMSLDREFFGMAPVMGEIYAVSGSEAPSSVEAYNPRTNWWRNVSDIPQKVEHHGVTSVGHFLYVAGGRNPDTKEIYKTLFRYDAIMDEWNQLEDMPTAGKYGVQLVATTINSTDYLMAIGGNNATGYDKVEFYNVETGRWLAKNDDSDQLTERMMKMTNQRVRPAVAVMSDGTVYMAGGQFHREYLSSVERLQPGPIDAEWQQMAPMEYARQGFSLVSVQIEL